MCLQKLNPQNGKDQPSNEIKIIEIFPASSILITVIMCNTPPTSTFFYLLLRSFCIHKTCVHCQLSSVFIHTVILVRLQSLVFSIYPLSMLSQ